uniref:Uncharacterized protein n=1 Tax=Lygus hesperus TaxID=30085 RepID=A0A0K8SHY5_LYGHE
MASSCDSTFTVKKKKRRSSLFDRHASVINDSTDTASTATSGSDANDAQLADYITLLKSCKRSWKMHEKELKSQLNSTTALEVQYKEYEDVRNNYLEYLDEQNRKFMEDVSPLVQRSSVHQKVDSIKEKVELLRSCYEEDKLLVSLFVENINQAVRYCEAVKFNEFSDKDEKTQNKSEISDKKIIDEIKIEVSENAPQVLEYNSDLSDLDE